MTDEQPPPSDAVSAPGDSAGSAAPASSLSRDVVTVRRSPRYGRFLVLGTGLGAVVTFVLTNLYPIDNDVGFGATFGYLLLFGIPIGASLGGLFAILLDVASSRGAKTVEAERTTVEAVPEELEGDLED